MYQEQFLCFHPFKRTVQSEAINNATVIFNFLFLLFYLSSFMYKYICLYFKTTEQHVYWKNCNVHRNQVLQLPLYNNLLRQRTLTFSLDQMYNYEVILNYYLEKTPKPKKERLLWAISPMSVVSRIYHSWQCTECIREEAPGQNFHEGNNK